MSNASDFVIKNGVLKKYNGNEAEVVIPEGVTKIGQYAFSKHKSLTGIIIPEGVTNIGRNAFDECESLTSITIPESVTKIGAFAFYNCKSLASITIPESVTEIGKWAFEYCTSLKEIVAGDISIIPTEYKKCAIRGFANSNGQGSEKRIESHKKHIKTNAAKLVDWAMEDINLLTLMCREKLITPKNLELFVQKANESKNAEAIALMLDYSQTKITAKQKEALEKKKDAQEEEIFERAIARSEKKGIEGLRFATTGKLETFTNRDELKEIIVENGGCFATTISSKVDYLITNDTGTGSEKNKKAQEMGIEIITEYEFNKKINRIFQIDREGVLVRYIGAGGDVVIPKGVTEIGISAFWVCTSLKSITIPYGVTKIGGSAFWGCKSLKSITIPDTVTEIGNWAFCVCESLASITIPDGVTKIGKEAFSRCESLTSITIPEGVTEIGYKAFDGCESLTSITIPKSVQSVEDWAFGGCENLISITISEGVKKIGGSAFSDCENLTIHAPAGSYAEEYAKENNIAFIAE